MRFKAVGGTLLGVAALVAIAGCGPDSASPPPASTSGAAATTTPQSEIANPLNTSKLAGEICSALTDTQLAPYLGVLDSKDPQQASNGPSCSYDPKDPLGPTVGAGVVNAATPTQESLYESAGSFPWRQKVSAIAGYPTVNYSTSFNASGGDCSTDVAVNATQSLHLEFSDTSKSDPNYAKPCVVSQALMTEFIQNVQAGS